MTNEELAAQAKAGDKDALAQLWEQNRGLLAKLFGELAGKAGARMAAMGVTAEDIEQSFFLAVELAVRLYEPERGVLFASFLKYPVKTVFFDLVGWRTASQKCDPLGRYVSLDEAVCGEDGSETARGELVPDPAAAQMFEDADDQLFTEQLHAVLEECLDNLGDRPAAVIRARYFEGKTPGQAGEQIGVSTSRAQQIEHDSMRKLRTPQNARRLQQFREQLISTRAHKGTGFNAWKNGGSVEERTVICLEDRGLL